MLTHDKHGDCLRVKGSLQVDQRILDPEHDVVVEVRVVPQCVVGRFVECGVDVRHDDLDGVLQGYQSKPGAERLLPVKAKEFHDLHEGEALDFTPGELRDEEVEVEDADVAMGQLHCEGNQVELTVCEDLELSAVSQEGGLVVVEGGLAWRDPTRGRQPSEEVIHLEFSTVIAHHQLKHSL